MSEAEFDLAAHGLESHYTRDQQYLIRRLMLEDWKQAGVKLPTYMKLVARYIIPDGIPEAWIKKLSHQTMAKMLTGESTPRHAFWACLHFYLEKKYPQTGIVSNAPDDVEVLGSSLQRFLRQGAPIEQALTWTPEAGGFNQDAVAYAFTPEGKGFTRVGVSERFFLDEPFAEPVFTSFEGAGLVQDGKLMVVLREIGEDAVRYLVLPLKEAREVAAPVPAMEGKQDSIYADLQMRATRMAGAGE